MKYYLPIIKHKHMGYCVKCPIKNDLVRISHHRDACVPSGNCSNDSTCQYHKGKSSKHEKVAESYTDWVEICDIPNEMVMGKLF